MTIVRAGGFLVCVTLLAGVVSAHNGEYKTPPGRSGPPGSGKRITPGTPIPKRPDPKTPTFDGPATTPDPRATERQGALPWELVWELLRDGEPKPAAPIPDEALRDARAALVAALADESLEVRIHAALALARGDRVDLVVPALVADGELLRSFATLAPGLGNLSTQLDDDLRSRVLPLMDHALREPEGPLLARSGAALSAGLVGAGGANVLVRALGSKPPEPIRRACLMALGLSGHPGSREMLLPEILPPTGRPDDSAIRAAFVYALSMTTAVDVERDLIKRLRDPDHRVRAAAALSLSGRIRFMPHARGAVFDVAKAGPLLPRSAALLSLALAGDRQAADLAKAALTDGVARGTGLPALAALSLGLLRAAEAGPDLVRLAADASREKGLRCAAALAAGLTRARGGGEKLAKLVRAERDGEVAAYALIGLALLDPELARPLAIRAFRTAKRVRIRYLVAQALGRTNGKATVDVLVPALGDDYDVNREAVRSLFRVDPERAVREVLVRLSDAKNPFARRFAVLALSRACDRRWPTFAGRTLLGMGLDTRTPLASMLLYLEGELLFERWGHK